MSHGVKPKTRSGRLVIRPALGIVWQCERYCPQCGARCLGGHPADSDAHWCANMHPWGSFDE